MADVNLSKAVRTNLLSLQSTAAQMSKTQNRLATGLKVNSALDNPSNFFTASALNSRAGDMANLLDSMSSGIKTIEAADNGLKSITKTVESMQSTLRQARQDKSFKTTSLELGDPQSGTNSITFSGGSVGSVGKSIELNRSGASADGAGVYAAPAAAARSTYTAAAAYVTPGAAQALDITFGTSSVSVSLTAADVTVDDAIETINTAIAGDADSAGQIEAYNNGGNLALRSTANTDTAITVAGAGETTIFGAQTAVTGSDGKHNIVVNGTAVNYSGANADAAAADITEQLRTTDFEAVNNAGTLEIRAKVNGANTLSITGTDSALFGAASVGTLTGPGTTQSVDELVKTINNSSVSENVRASNDNGKLRIENLSTKELTIGGVNSSTGKVDGTGGTETVGGNDVRKNLVKQFNELRDQLDKFSDDASFNGINLLRGDKLKLTFNETGTSTIEIQAKDKSNQATQINSASLDIDSVTDADFDTDTTLDAKLDVLKSSLDSLRSQSSTFGSNLSVVENRQDFTKNMINTLETGAANLTLADTNEEAANLLALQTRQQLSSTALSMASQADQAVLRLF